MVRDDSALEGAVAGVRAAAAAAGLHVRDVIPSPIAGGDGNREFLMAARLG